MLNLFSLLKALPPWACTEPEALTLKYSDSWPVFFVSNVCTFYVLKHRRLNNPPHELLCIFFSPASTAPSELQLDADTWDNKTITSGLKNYFRWYRGESGEEEFGTTQLIFKFLFNRCLAEPLLTYRLHKDFIKAASKRPFWLTMVKDPQQV